MSSERGSAQNTEHSGADETPPLWEFVPLGSFCAPKSSSEQLVRKWGALKRLLKRDTAAEESPFKPEADLQRLPGTLRERLTAPVEWADALDALELALNSWSGAEGEPRVVFVVGPPWSGCAGILRAWAAAHQTACIEAPAPEDILQRDFTSIQIPQAQKQAWVMPELERCYLRHAEGLDLVRHFLENAMCGAYGPGIIGCDSWAWAYLQYVWPAHSASVLTLQGLDGARLSRLLRQLSVARVRENFCFKSAGNGNTILCAEDDANARATAAITHLAVRARGNVGLALHYWRDALRSEPESEEEQKSEEDTTADKTRTVWVADLASSPVPPHDDTDNIAFILHTLLLHHGVEEELLPELLPMSRQHAMATLLRLRDSGILQQQNNLWYVAPLAYHGTCTYLREHNYLMDAFQG
jgi:hypothetical protein